MNSEAPAPNDETIAEMRWSTCSEQIQCGVWWAEAEGLVEAAPIDHVNGDGGGQARATDDSGIAEMRRRQSHAARIFPKYSDYVSHFVKINGIAPSARLPLTGPQRQRTNRTVARHGR